MLVVDVDALQTVDFLNLVDQVLLQFLFAEYRQNVVRIARAIHQRLAGLDLLAFLNLDVHAAGQRVFALLAVFAFDVDLALALADFAVLHRAVDLRHDGRLTRLARFEQFHHARQTAGDVLGLGGFARDLGQHVAGVDFLAVANHQVSVGRHQVLLGFRTRPVAPSGRTTISGCRFSSGESITTSCDIPVTSSSCSCMVRPSMRSLKWTTPLTSVRIENVYGSHSSRIWLLFTGAPSSTSTRAPYTRRVAFLFAALIVHHRHDAVAVHGDQFADLAADGLDADVAGETVALGVLLGLLVDSRRRTTDVERTHGQLRARFADGLRRDHADRFAALHQPSGRQVAAVARHADAALGFAGQHRADLDALDTGRLNRRRQFFGDLLVDVDDDVAFVILLIFERHAAHDAVAQRLR